MQATDKKYLCLSQLPELLLETVRYCVLGACACVSNTETAGSEILAKLTVLLRPQHLTDNAACFTTDVFVFQRHSACAEMLC